MCCTRLDATDCASIEAAVEEGIKQFGGLDVLLNSAGAGYGADGPLEADHVMVFPAIRCYRYPLDWKAEPLWGWRWDTDKIISTD